MHSMHTGTYILEMRNVYFEMKCLTENNLIMHMNLMKSDKSQQSSLNYISLNNWFIITIEHYVNSQT